MWTKQINQYTLFMFWNQNAAAAAKSLQSCLTLCDPIDQPTRLHRPWDFPGKDTGVGCHFLLQCMKVKSESEVSQLCPTLYDPMDCSLPGSSACGIFQARVLEWVAIAFSEATVYGVAKSWTRLHFHFHFNTWFTGLLWDVNAIHLKQPIFGIQ